MSDVIKVERLVYPAGSRYRWLVYETSTGHVFEQGYTKHRGVAENQTRQAALVLSEALGMSVELSEIGGMGVVSHEPV